MIAIESELPRRYSRRGTRARERSEMRRQIKRKLPDDVYSKSEQERLAAALIDLLKVRKGR